MSLVRDLVTLVLHLFSLGYQQGLAVVEPDVFVEAISFRTAVIDSGFRPLRPTLKRVIAACERNETFVRNQSAAPDSADLQLFRGD